MKTLDYAAGNYRFYTTEKLGPKQSVTPEGYLLVQDVPIARTGLMLYGPGEVPVDPDGHDHIKIWRKPEDVFTEDTIASFQGKSVTDDHPPEDVDPSNFKKYECGQVINPRRGTGAQDDLLLADLIIKCPDAIAAIRAGKREVSCGYDADYEDLGNGEGRQYNIIGNHLALVDSGRCGPRCAIGDRKSTPSKESTMSKMTWDGLKRLIRKAVKDGNEEALEEALQKGEEMSGDKARDGEGEEGGETHVHLHMGAQEGSSTGGVEGLDKRGRDDARTTDDDIAELKEGHEKMEGMLHEILSRLDALEGGSGDAKAADRRGKDRKGKDGEEGELGDDPELKAETGDTDEEVEKELEKEAPEGMEDRARKAHDSSYLTGAWKDALSKAEILSPGIKAPTFDRSADPKLSFRQLCNFRRKALDKAWADQNSQAVLASLNSGRRPDVTKLTCDATRTLFNAAAMLRSQMTMQGLRPTGFGAAPQTQHGQPARSLADLNRINADYYASKATTH